MRCSNAAERRPVVLAIVLLAVALAGCGTGDGRLDISGVRTAPFESPELALAMTLAPDVRDALDRGVALGFRLDLEIDGNAEDTQWRELRYLPLTRQYQVRGPAPGYSRSYSSRAAALAALERWPLPGRASQGVVLARVRLDRARLAAPLVLPAVFNRDWRIDSGTTQWLPRSR